MMRFLTLLILVCTVKPSFGRIIIDGKLIHAKSSGDVYYYKPINGFSNINFNAQKVSFKDASSFHIEDSIETPGFFFLMLPQKIIALFLRPSDHIKMDVQYGFDSSKGGPVFQKALFQGPNAKGHELYCSQDVSQEDLYKTLFSKSYGQLSLFFEAYSDKLQSLLHPFDSLYRLKEITEEYYKTVSIGMQGAYAWNVINLFDFLTRNNTPGIIKLKNGNAQSALALNRQLLCHENFDRLRQMIYQRVNPFDERLLCSLLAPGLTDYFCRDLYSGITRSSVRYDSSFLKVNEHDRPLGYLKGRFLECMWAKQLYVDVIHEFDQAELKEEYDLFFRRFPRSPFVPLLQTRLREALGDNAFAGGLNRELVILPNQGTSTLEALVKEHFSSQYVFVDLWATWCTPCVREFLYKNQLKKFLDKENIALLYISIDEETNEDKWEKLIKGRQLYGTHVRASTALLKDVRRELYVGREITVPRYLLINRQGKVIGFDLPRPSEAQSLQNAIIKLVREDN